eukprot:g41036.t1
MAQQATQLYQSLQSLKEMKPGGSPDINLITWHRPRHRKRQRQKQPCRSCKVFLTNICGLVPTLEELSHRLVKQQPDIVIFTESYLTDNVPDTTITITGYALSHRQDKPSRDGGTV